MENGAGNDGNVHSESFSKSFSSQMGQNGEIMQKQNSEGQQEECHNGKCKIVQCKNGVCREMEKQQAQGRAGDSHKFMGGSKNEQPAHLAGVDMGLDIGSSIERDMARMGENMQRVQRSMENGFKRSM